MSLQWGRGQGGWRGVGAWPLEAEESAPFGAQVGVCLSLQALPPLHMDKQEEGPSGASHQEAAGAPDLGSPPGVWGGQPAPPPCRHHTKAPCLRQPGPLCLSAGPPSTARVAFSRADSFTIPTATPHHHPVYSFPEPSIKSRNLAAPGLLDAPPCPHPQRIGLSGTPTLLQLSPPRSGFPAQPPPPKSLTAQIS